MSLATLVRGGARAVRDTVDELLGYLTAEEQAVLDHDLALLTPAAKGVPVPADWQRRVPLVFARYASSPMGERHIDMWNWANAIRLDSAPEPFVGVWPRGGGKSTTAEMIVADVGCRGVRRYCLYIRATQDKADASVQNIAALLESDEIARHYPDHAKRKIGKFGNAKAWRRNRLWTAGGFAVDALGLDVAARGVKLEENRPDFIVFDDIDDLHDGPSHTKRKRDTITLSILPAGAKNVATLGIQNLIIPDGIFSQLADGRADFLVLRKVSGPFPAIAGFTYRWELNTETGTRRAVIASGTATWDGQSLADCQHLIDTIGVSAFLKECQHKVKERAEGACLRFDASRHYKDIDDDEARVLCTIGKPFGGIDFGAWRFAFTLWTVTPVRAGRYGGKVIRIDELFSQKEGLAVRARAVHELCELYGLEPTKRGIALWGDAANPQDILELNLAFKAGWPQVDEQGHETGRLITSALRVRPVAAENKLRKVAVERINNNLDKNILIFRRSIGSDHVWRYGWNAGSEGTEKTGSRLMWEIDSWAYPVPREGDAQKQDPDDDTADGADAVASMRYALMSAWRPGALAEEFGIVPDDTSRSYDYKKKKLVEAPHAADKLRQLTAPAARTPRVRTPRPRLSRGSVS